MNELLDRILTAHGGLARWRNFTEVRATIVTDGAFWGIKGLVQDQAPRRMTVGLRQQRASVTPFGAPDQKTAFSADRIAIEKLDGTIVAERSNPRAMFDGHEMTTPWSPLHRAYFNGYALWTYLTSPFLLALPGVGVEEVEPWNEGGQVWRRLRATFPAGIATHSDKQDFFFDSELNLRRHDYNVDVAGGFDAAQYVDDTVDADGIRVQTRRRAYRRGPDGRALTDVVMVAIDLSDISFT
ncbi:hypothetical protein [Bradyrhizobium prioriisuperbiae]|uniref:hypothetical protein n=1 Tax=Bradyrhizobium prioriisuperbiae TaxID=2854389 RepID=UPI0028E2099F|nr:hypothetical protein [Bradyrhizobium prioritasuperba]